jgi:hypothetical protein
MCGQNAVCKNGFVITDVPSLAKNAQLCLQFEKEIVVFVIS